MIERRVTLPAGAGYELVPTLDALRKINRRFDDLISVAKRIGSADFDAIAFVASAGAGLNGKAQIDQLERDIFEHGIVNCLGPISEYVSLLMDPHADAGEDDSPGKG